MRVPEGIDSSKYASKVLKLDHALNGFKQAGRVWNSSDPRVPERTWLPAHQVKRLPLRLQREGGGGLATHDIALYVDDLLFVSPDLNEIQRIKGDLKSEYGIMDLGEARSR